MNRLSAFLLRLLGQLSAELVLAMVAFAASFAGFLYLTRLVFYAGPEQFDSAVFAWFDQLRAARPGLTDWVRGVTFFGSARWFVAVALLLPALLWWRKLRREAVEVFAAVAGAALFNQGLKLYFGRVRPDTALLPQPGLSFPSGHAMIGVALYGMLAWHLWQHGRRVGGMAALLLWALLIGLSRIYLHVHYPTDVLAGFAAGTLWVVVVRLTVQQRLKRD
ncbi:phosphatase PAP2 family protein [Hymenobacter sp. B81]|uniref:phosphatase PAP2 family protein n=1 Tax=Hymenobacter sp. B81 TaxID=3344878 RepID=UPI0037DCC862